MYTTSNYVTLAEYRRITAEMQRWLASENRKRKQRSPRSEIFKSVSIPEHIDVDYG